jgi:metal-dependent hydrolase (beta-lactamase superfamily II)
MKIKVLGVGGFNNTGLNGNSFLVDNHILLEAPPDIIQSLSFNKVTRTKIDNIYISHLHGDHYFGLPFLLFNIFMDTQQQRRFRIIGPKGLKEAIIELSEIAISKDHWLVKRINDNCSFEIINNQTLLQIDNYTISFYGMFHEKETYGIGFSENNKLLFQYLADTEWNNGLLPYFNECSKIIICDINGTGVTQNKVHMSIEDITNNIDWKLMKYSMVYGTHLSRHIKSNSKHVKIAQTGKTISVI